jgi:hypothetical protein
MSQFGSEDFACARVERTLPPRHCERREAIHLAAQRKKLDCFASLAMTKTHIYAATTMYRLVAAQNTNADRLTAAPSQQTPCQPAWA